MLAERLLHNLRIEVEPFAACVVSTGWQLLLDELPTLTLHFVLRGRGQLLAPGAEPVELEAGHLAIVPRGLDHRLRSGPNPADSADTSVGEAGDSGLVRFVAGADGDQQLLVACGRIEVAIAEARRLFEPMTSPLAVDFTDAPWVAGIFDRLLVESEADTLGSRAMMAALMNQCLVAVLRRLLQEPDVAAPWLLALRDERMATVVEHVLRRPGDDHGLESMAALAGMGRSTFTAEFTNSFDQTPMAFVRDVRLRRAADLLETTDLTISAVAHRVGFASRSHFSRAFVQHFATTPSAFRADRMAEA